MKEHFGKKSYTEEFKKEVVKAALNSGTSMSAVARKYEINLTLVRNWKAKYEVEILQEIDKNAGDDSVREVQKNNAVSASENKIRDQPKEFSMLNFEIENKIHSLHCYIAADEGFVSSIILYSRLQMTHGDVWFGAYYGAVGGGESDGGYFRIDIEDGKSEHLDYDDVDGLSEDEPDQAAILEAVMQSLWTLVDDDEGDLTVSDEGSQHYIPDDDGIWFDEEFDGDSLDEISQQWKIQLRFQS